MAVSAVKSDAEPVGAKLDDIGPRIASSVVLIAIGLSVAVLGGPWIAAATGAAVVIMSYEWCRMSERGALRTSFAFCLAGALGAVMAASWQAYPAAFGWMVIVAAASAARRRTLAGVLETAGGIVYVGTPCVLFLMLRAHEPGGLWIILGLFSIIWAADAAAYFGGKLLGGPKLVPNLSPAKTWSGFASGTVAGLLAAGAYATFIGGPPAQWAFAGAVLALVGLLGDLLESLVKRRFGVKDASRLIPGHGGLLDRIDGLMAATVVTAFAIGLAPDVAPAMLGAVR